MSNSTVEILSISVTHLPVEDMVVTIPIPICLLTRDPVGVMEVITGSALL